MKNIVHIAPFNRNIGDNALNLAIEDMLGKNFNFTHLELVGNKFDKPVYEKLLSADGIIFGGGGVIHSCSGNSSRLNRTKTGTMWNMDLSLIRKVAHKTCLYSVGFNRFEGEPPPLPVMGSFFATLLSSGSLISMRNDGSADRLADYFPELKGRVATIPDPGLLYRGKAGLRKGDYVIVQIATDRIDFRFPGGLEMFLDLLNELLVTIPYKKILLPHTVSDENIYKQISSSIRVDEVVPMDLSIKNTDAMIGLYTGAKFSISTRGHSQLCSIGNLCPTFAISTHPKVKGFFDTVGLSEYCFDYLNEDKSTALAKFANFSSDLPKIRRKLKKICEGFRNEADRFNRQVIDFFEKTPKSLSSHGTIANKKEKTRGVVYAADQGYFDGFKTSLNSLKKWHPELSITLFDLGLNKAQRTWCKSEGIIVKNLEYVTKLNVSVIPGQHLNTAAIASLYIHKSDYDEVLFIDCDVLVVEKLDRFFEGLSNHEIVTVQGSALKKLDYGYRHTLSDELTSDGQLAVEELFTGISLSHPAINTGCFAARTSLFQRWEPYYQPLFRIFVHFKYADQSAINVLRSFTKPSELLLPSNYDFTGISITNSWNSNDDRMKISIEGDGRLRVKFDSLTIHALHFSGRNKPWKFFAFTRRSFAWFYYDKAHSISEPDILSWYERVACSSDGTTVNQEMFVNRLPRLEKIEYAQFLASKNQPMLAEQLLLVALAEKASSPVTLRNLYFCAANSGRLRQARGYLRDYLLLKSDNREMVVEKGSQDFLRHLDSEAAILSDGGGPRSVSSMALELTSMRFSKDIDIFDSLIPRIKDLSGDSVFSIAAILHQLKRYSPSIDLNSGELRLSNPGFWNKTHNGSIRFQSDIIFEINYLIKLKNISIKEIRISDEFYILQGIFSSLPAERDGVIIHIDPLASTKSSNLSDSIGKWASSVSVGDMVYTTLPYLSKDAYDASLYIGIGFQSCFAEQELIDAASEFGFEMIYQSWRGKICHIFFEKVSDVDRPPTKLSSKDAISYVDQLTATEIAKSCLRISRHRSTRCQQRAGWVHQSWSKSHNFGDRLLSADVKSLMDVDRLFGDQIASLDLSSNLTERSMSLISDSLLWVIGGGGIFIPDSAMGRSSIWAVPAKTIRDISTPKALLAVDVNGTIEDLTNTNFIDDVSEYLDAVDYIGFRSMAGLQWIKENLNPEIYKKSFYQPCPTLFSSEIYSSQNYLRFSEARSQVMRVGFNFGFDRIQKRVGNAFSGIVTELIDCAKMLVQKKIEIVVLIHCPEDSMLSEIFRIANIPFEEAMLTSMQNDRARNLYAGLDLVIGSRLHSVYIPYGLTVPVVPIDLHPKISWAIKDFGIPHSWKPLEPSHCELNEIVVEAMQESSLLNGYHLNRNNNIENYRRSRLNLVQLAISSK